MHASKTAFGLKKPPLAGEASETNGVIPLTSDRDRKDLGERRKTLFYFYLSTFMTRSSQISRVGWGVPKKMEECERHRQCSKQRRTETPAFCQTQQSLVTLNDFSVIFKARYCLRHFSIHVISLEERVFRRHFLTNIASCASS